MYLDTPDFLSNALHFLTVLGVPLHIFGSYCILFKTPKNMSTVKWTMFSLHFWCMSLDWSVTILTVPFLLFPAMAGYPLGVLTMLGVRTDLQVYLIVSLLFSDAAIVAIFENRYFQIFARDQNWRRYRIPLLTINYVLSFTFFIPALVTVPEQGPALEEVYRLLPSLPSYVHELPIFVLAVDVKYVVIPIDAMASLMTIESFTFVWLLYKNMSKISETSMLSANTFKLQRKFLKAVYIQVDVYMLNIIIPLLVILASMLSNFYSQAANNLVFIFLACHGLSSTIIMLWAHKPYRTFCGEIFRSDFLVGRSRFSVSIRPKRSIRDESYQRSVANMTGEIHSILPYF
ncbi:hypothetical protein CAEBREN_32740 [Caenorhabditis brenneri]|uniref:Serpentine Receptor, class H n=1 Tax=Caenorhabditis brenneri TaxID=135651 RepID=G0M8U3_CAEBE|nr:hypothetical protein CAEBREN_32740 [Caenorhabditis brenneri]